MTTNTTITPELLDQLLANYEKLKTSPVDAEGWRRRESLMFMRLCAIQWLSGQGARPARVGEAPGGGDPGLDRVRYRTTYCCMFSELEGCRSDTFWSCAVFTLLPTARDATFICRF